MNWEDERHLKALCTLFPDADVHTLFYRPDAVPEMISPTTLRPSRLQRLPAITRYYAYYMPLFPTIIEHIDLRAYDLVISNNRYFAKGVLTQPETCHINFLHASVLSLWQNAGAQASDSSAPFRSVYPFLINYYRLWDIVSSQRVDYFITESQLVSRHINKYYRRSDVSIIDGTAEPEPYQRNLFALIYQIMDAFQARQQTISQDHVMPDQPIRPAESPFMKE